MWTTAPQDLRLEDGNPQTHTIITTKANELVQPIHPTRMPVILDPSNYEAWLTGT
ncbi:MAG: SOS response-associated peptidase family protein, partial [Pseudomonadota bacterium]